MPIHARKARRKACSRMNCKLIIGIPEAYGVVAVIPIGFPAGRFGPVTREPVEFKIYSETWGGQSAG